LRCSGDVLGCPRVGRRGKGMFFGMLGDVKMLKDVFWDVRVDKDVHL